MHTHEDRISQIVSLARQITSYTPTLMPVDFDGITGTTVYEVSYSSPHYPPSIVSITADGSHVTWTRGYLDSRNTYRLELIARTIATADDGAPLELVRYREYSRSVAQYMDGNLPQLFLGVAE